MIDDEDLDDEGEPDVEWFPIPEALLAAADEIAPTDAA